MSRRDVQVEATFRLGPIHMYLRGGKEDRGDRGNRGGKESQQWEHSWGSKSSTLPNSAFDNILFNKVNEKECTFV